MKPVIAWNMVPAIDIIRPIVEPPPEYKILLNTHSIISEDPEQAGNVIWSPVNRVVFFKYLTYIRVSDCEDNRGFLL